MRLREPWRGVAISGRSLGVNAVLLQRGESAARTDGAAWNRL
jgi:hypothetical protein